MARDLTTIYNGIVTKMRTFPQLNAISLASAVGVANLIIGIVSDGIRTVETLFDSAEAEINAKINSQISGTSPWYQTKCLEFQLGDTLQADGTYATLDATKQIISRCAVVDINDGSLTIKVAKGSIGSESALSNQELTQFSTYMQKIKFAGTALNIISLNADQIKITGTVYFNGIYAMSDMQTSVINALNNYLANGLTFNGNLLVNQLIEEVLKVQGVYDFYISDMTAIVGVNTYTVTREYETFAGYITQATGTGNTFLETISFVPQVNS
ncbi:MAG: hypothetical protein JSS79_05225 [Bacteroidetes bacterium]|nr:hypothetical protein [Bacteroidota bacterium]